MRQRLLRIALLVVAGFNAVSAVGGGIGLIATAGLGLPDEWLDPLPFSSWLVPGLLLTLVVGGTQVIAVAMHARRRPLALAVSAFSGVTMVIWTYVEVAVLPEYSFLHTLYLSTGLAQVVLVLLALGVLERRAELPLSA